MLNITTLSKISPFDRYYVFTRKSLSLSLKIENKNDDDDDEGIVRLHYLTILRNFLNFKYSKKSLSLSLRLYMSEFKIFTKF